ncbi:MAG: hypothetical protein JO086_00045 [Acidimicrobiia bacterium]|nr:hypothetical protein [Acidimicrobiia bacterium]
MTPAGQLAAAAAPTSTSRWVIAGGLAVLGLAGWALLERRPAPRRRNPRGIPFSGARYRPVRGGRGRRKQRRVYLTADELAALRPCAEARRGARRRFASRDAYVRALLDANPRLFDFIENEGGRRRQISGGYFDPFNEALELRGKRRVTTWGQALAATAPSSREWADGGERIALLEDVVRYAGGRFPVSEPDETKAALDQRPVDEECEKQNVWAVLPLARRRRRPPPDAPF